MGMEASCCTFNPHMLHLCKACTDSLRPSGAAHPARNAHLLSTLALNLLRVEVAIIPQIPTQCPMAPLFATQQVLPAPQSPTLLFL